MGPPTRRSPSAWCISPLRRRRVWVCAVGLGSSWSSTSPSSFCRRACLGAEFEWSCVEPSVALFVDPVHPRLARVDLFAGVLEADVSRELSGCADRRIEALAEAVLLDQRRVEAPDRAVAFLAWHGHQPFGRSVRFRA